MRVSVLVIYTKLHACEERGMGDHAFICVWVESSTVCTVLQCVCVCMCMSVCVCVFTLEVGAVHDGSLHIRRQILAIQTRRVDISPRLGHTQITSDYGLLLPALG